MIGLVDILEEYEAGYLDAEEQLDLFAELIRTGWVWTLREEPYGCTAHQLIDAGYITPAGKTTPEGYALAAQHEESTADQRLLTGGADEAVPGPFATPNVNT